MNKIFSLVFLQANLLFVNSMFFFGSIQVRKIILFCYMDITEMNEFFLEKKKKKLFLILGDCLEAL